MLTRFHTELMLRVWTIDAIAGQWWFTFLLGVWGILILKINVGCELSRVPPLYKTLVEPML